MALAVTASLIGSDAPYPVQVVVAGLGVGTAVTVTASWSGGSSVVRGASGVVTNSTQLVLTDVMVPINVPVTYTAVQGASTASSSPVTVAWTGRYVLTALDGSGAVAFRWLDTNDERELALRAVTFQIAGRSTPVSRYDVTSSDEGEWVVVTQQAMTPALRALLASGEPMVLRTDGTVRDLPAVSVAQVTGAANRLHVGNSRRWSLAWVEVDDPDADLVLVLATFADFDAIYTGKTFADFDAEWAGQTFADFDAEDWRGRSGL